VLKIDLILFKNKNSALLVWNLSKYNSWNLCWR